jgi:SHS2 domain-containing protein
MEENHFEEIEHTADWALHIRAKDFEGLLRNAAQGMLELMGIACDEDGVRERKMEVHGIDRETLLVSWLEEVLYVVERYGVGIGSIELHVSKDTHLVATINEIPSIIPKKEIKAVTYHGLNIRETEHGLEVTIVFDV